MLIVIGVTPIIARDMQRRTKEIPREQLIKAQTLGANTSQIIWRVLLPQLTPRLIGSIRLTMGTAWLFLIAAEAIASTDGLGLPNFSGTPLSWPWMSFCLMSRGLRYWLFSLTWL